MDRLLLENRRALSFTKKYSASTEKKKIIQNDLPWVAQDREAKGVSLERVDSGDKE